MIFWKYDEHPIFVSDNQEGDRIELSFGLEHVDDIQISGEAFCIYLEKDGRGWQAKIDKERASETIHGGMIRKLITELNAALETRSDFDLVKYVTANKERYAYFSHTVRWRTKR